MKIRNKLLGLRFRQKDNHLYSFEFDKPVDYSFDTFFCKELEITFFNLKTHEIESIRLKPFKIYKPKIKYNYVIERFV